MTTITIAGHVAEEGSEAHSSLRAAVYYKGYELCAGTEKGRSEGRLHHENLMTLATRATGYIGRADDTITTQPKE